MNSPENAGPNLSGQNAPEDGFIPLPKKQLVLTMAGVMVALFLASLDQTIVSTAMPRIIADLEGFDRFTWVTTAYLLASTTVLPIVGKLSDSYGRKGFLISGTVIFLGGSVLAGLSQDMTQLIIFRGIQGIGGGTMMAIAFIAVADLFPAGERGKYQGMLGSVFALSSIIGPTLGGFVTDQLSWHWIFYINIPLGIAVIALFVVFFPQITPATREHRLDYAGIVALVLSVVSLLLALSWGGGQYDWVSGQVLGLMIFGSVMVLVFIVVESRAADPIMPLWVFRYPSVSVSLVVTSLSGFGMFGVIVFIPLYFQGVLGASATNSGSFLTPMMLGIVVGAIISGQALSRLGAHYRLQGLIGLGIMAAGMLLLSGMSADTSFSRAVGNIVLMGFGLGMTFPVYTLVVQNSVPRRVLGVATSSLQFFRSIGGTLGLAILGSVVTSRFATALPGSVPESVQQVIPSEKLATITGDPYALLSPEAGAQLEQSFESIGPEGIGLLSEFMDVLRQALSSAISDVFLISLAMVIAAWVVTLFLKGIPQGDQSKIRPKDRPEDGQPRDPLVVAARPD